MALTEEQKRKIEEEEVYRAKVREESQTIKKGRSGCSGCLVVFLVIIALFGITLVSINPAKQFEEAERKSTTPTITTITGKFLDHNYEILQNDGESKYVATFSPFLPSNDAILTGAMFTVMGEIYGKHNLTDLKAEFVPIEGVLAGTPQAKTRCSPFAALKAA